MQRTSLPWSLLNPTVPTVGASSRGVTLRISSVNLMQYLCCILVRVAIRLLRKVVTEKHTLKNLLCLHKPNTAFTFHCTCVSWTPLTWPKQHTCLWLREVYVRSQFSIACKQVALDPANKRR